MDKEHFHFHGTRRYWSRLCEACTNAKRSEQYLSDAEYREKLKAYQRSPAAQDSKNALRKEKYATATKYRENLLADQRAKYAKDPEYREGRKAYQRRSETRQRKNSLRKGGMPPTPIAANRYCQSSVLPRVGNGPTSGAGSAGARIPNGGTG